MKSTFWVEMAASVLTLVGMYEGSTTTTGSILYLASIGFWCWLILEKKMFGLIPLNIAAAAVSVINLYKSLNI